MANSRKASNIGCVYDYLDDLLAKYPHDIDEVDLNRRNCPLFVAIRQKANSDEFNKRYQKLVTLVGELKKPWPSVTWEDMQEEKLGESLMNYRVTEFFFLNAIRVLRQMPLMEVVDKAALAELLNTRFFGIVIILNAMYYKRELDAVEFPVENSNKNMEVRVIPIRDIIQLRLGNHINIDWDFVKSSMGFSGLEDVYRVLDSFFLTLQDIFGEQIGEVSLAIAGVHIFRQTPSCSKSTVHPNLELERSYRDLVNYFLMQRTWSQPLSSYLEAYQQVSACLNNLWALDSLFRYSLTLLPPSAISPLLKEIANPL